MNKQEEKLFDEIQYLVEELPWTNKLNLDYFETCVHEAGHGVAMLRVCKKFNNPAGLSKLTLEARVFDGNKHPGGQATPRHCKGEIQFMLSLLPALYIKYVAQSGAILSDEFYNYYYGWGKVRSFEELEKEYGASSDYTAALRLGSVGCYITKLILRLSYSSSEVRLLHLRLIRDLLKSNGKLVIKDPEKYVKEKEL